MGGGHEEDAVQVKAAGGLACDGQMRVVDWVEGAAEDCEFHGSIAGIGSPERRGDSEKHAETPIVFRF